MKGKFKLSGLLLRTRRPLVLASLVLMLLLTAYLVQLTFEAVFSTNWETEEIDPEFDSTRAIPRIFHQSWKSKKVPDLFQPWIDSCKNLHPKWKHKLWTDPENEALVARVVPWFFERFMAYPRQINRVDASRYVYMYAYGGVYTDLDLECLNPLDPLLEEGGLVVGKMSRDDNFEHNIPNAFLASQKGHPFWLYLLKKMNDMPNGAGVEVMTGPVVLFKTLKEYQKEVEAKTAPPIRIMEAGLIYPYDWHWPVGTAHICSAQSSEFDPTQCKDIHDPAHRAYTMTYWSHSWDDEKVLERHQATKSEK